MQNRNFGFGRPSFLAMAIANILALTCTGVSAQDNDPSGPPEPAQQTENEQIRDVDRMVVYGQIGFRNRTTAIQPVLEYDRAYFERFEPDSAGDALKRVPSVTFLSDVTESDGARLRGLNPGYTQILINGERVPGVGNDRSFLLDRIPAELIARVEIVRSSSANRPADGVAGAINIELRDSFEFDGGYLKAGASNFDGEEWKENVAGVWGGKLGPGRLVAGITRQGRFNPKLKLSRRFGDSPENNPNFMAEEFENREVQTDVRDSTDMSYSLDYALAFADESRLELSGVLVDTDRDENERSFEFDDLDPEASADQVNEGGNLETDNQQRQDIEELSYSIDAKYSRPLFGGEAKLKIVYADFDSETDDIETEIDFTDPVAVLEEERALEDIEDSEFTIELAQAFEIGSRSTFEFGAFYLTKERNTTILEAEDERELALSGWNIKGPDTPLSISNELTGLEPIDGGVFTIEEDRLDFFALIKGQAGAIEWETGLRYETTDQDVTDATVDPSLARSSNDYDFLMPSAHLRYDLTERDRVSASVARTVRRPDFNFLTPALLEDEIAENDLQGNPLLDPETAWGFDVGYERRIGDRGIVGINFFYRDVQDKIELTSTGEEGSEGPGSFIFTPDNIGDGWVRGVEFDLSAPLSIVNLNNTGIFANLSFLDSEVDDPFGERQFNDQSDWVYNAGFIQDLPALGAAFGATFRKQGDATGRVLGEEVITEYDADLEFFVEKRWENFTLRAVGSNLLDGSKDETFNKFDTIEDQRDRDFDEFELETEEAGPIFRIVARYAF